MRRTTIFAAAASSAAIALAGCASAPQEAGLGPDPYRAALYTGAPQPDVADQIAFLRAPVQTSANGTTFELVSYAGIDGARRAHALYTEAEAEALDGRCEARIRPSQSESMIDIADLCDVPLDLLVEYNPGVADISYQVSDSTVRIPGGIENPKGFAALTGALVQLDAVRPGDTIEKIAYRLDVTPAAIANLNPGIDWTKPAAGQAFVAPASGSAPAYMAASNNYAPPAEIPTWEGYSGGQGIAGSNAGSAVGTAHAPYQLKPVKSYARARGVYPDADVSVDKPYVKVGDSVEVTAKATAGNDVTFYYGDAPGDDMTQSKTVRANKDGLATTTIKVKKNSNMGGVVFGAREQGSSDTKYSDRVGVVKLGEGADKKKESDEDSEEASDEN